MVLEWYRTFKSGYKNGNFSLAAKELLLVSQRSASRYQLAHVSKQITNENPKALRQ
jgi:hypothetical protein